MIVLACRQDINLAHDANNDGTANLNDLFAASDDITGTIGAFRAPLSTSGLRNVDDQFFVNRSIIGNATSARQAGAMLNGAFEDQLSWWIAVQNGVDGTDDEHQISARGTFDFMGNGHGAGATEGSYGGSDDMNGSVGVSFGDDGGGAAPVGADLDGAEAGADLSAAVGDAAGDGLRVLRLVEEEVRQQRVALGVVVRHQNAS